VPQTVLLLHGQPGGVRDWDRVVTALGDRAKPIVFYRPGWNGSSPPADLAGNVAAAVRELDARGVVRATVVGHSLGGAVAALLAAEHPDRVDALVLAAPAANRAALSALDHWLAARFAGAVTGAALLAGVGVALAGPPVRRWIAAALTLDEEYLRVAARRLLTPAAWRAFTFEQRALIAGLPALEAALEQIAAPTTIVAGSDDWIVPLAAARALAVRIPRAELKVIPGGTHLLTMQRPELIVDAILSTRG
jgi:pimeloyl-ACP methyl ester carboxylesterase